jgi:hypothetical protein
MRPGLGSLSCHWVFSLSSAPSHTRVLDADGSDAR